MKTTEHNTIAASGNLHPHGHRDPNSGPYTFRIGKRCQPEMVQEWKRATVSVGIEQTEENSNFTLIRVMFLRGGRKSPWLVAGVPMKQTKLYRKADGNIMFRIRKRICDKLVHPLPVGQYVGSCVYDVDGGFAVFTLQAITLRKEPEPQKPKTIITPGDVDFDVTLANAKRTLSRVDGLAGGGVDAGGLRHG